MWPIAYPLFSSTSTGSSNICVTFGNVSSAFNTGNVFDRKSNVRFRISSLEIRLRFRWIEFQDLFCSKFYLQWIRFAQHILSHWVSWNLAFIEIAANIVHRNKGIFTWNIFAFQIDVGVWWWPHFRRNRRSRFNKRIIPARRKSSLFSYTGFAFGQELVSEIEWLPFWWLFIVDRIVGCDEIGERAHHGRNLENGGY